MALCFLDILVEPLYAAQTVNIGEFDESKCSYRFYREGDTKPWFAGPVEHVRQQAREKTRETHQIFCEMLELCKVNGLDYSWYENARYECLVLASKHHRNYSPRRSDVSNRAR